jgi:hypothetical protein
MIAKDIHFLYRQVRAGFYDMSRKHFVAINCDKVKHEVVNSQEELLKVVR